MRFLFLAGLIFIIDWYAFQAFRTLSQEWSNTGKLILNSVYWSIPFVTVVFLFYVSYSNIQVSEHPTLSVLRAVLVIAYISKFLIIAILLIDDLRRLIMTIYESTTAAGSYDPTRSKFMSTLAVTLGSLPFISLTYGIIRNRHRYKIFKESIVLENLPNSLDGLKIVQISDIHSGSFTLKEPVKSAVDLINNQNPDLVFFTGDLVNSMASEMDRFLDVFDKINAKFGIYSILGNHDYGDYVKWPNDEMKRQNLENLKGHHRQMGWDLLLNENRILEINSEKVAVIGVENYSESRHFPKYGDLNKATQGIEHSRLKLLLSHDPTHWSSQVIQNYKDIDITFSGHTHGMQFGIEIPGWLKWSPAKFVYRHWAGLYQEGKQFLYVNRGLGYLGYPGRVGILPEITVIELKSGRIT
ncbi:MAG: metallophosphoesterase [Bacteroidetes bacterium]|jgi:predicted MPP superfamily phosphohydrolase|nr:metallophosphoesterase [Bacteroidota bacterium]MDF1867198.1 metallophosphoesterase [Saprospiraceae bacterium]